MNLNPLAPGGPQTTLASPAALLSALRDNVAGVLLGKPEVVPLGGDERAPGVGGRQDPAARPAVLRAGHAEPVRVRGHLPAAREPARPLPHAPAHRLPRPGRREARVVRPPRGRAGRSAGA